MKDGVDFFVDAHGKTTYTGGSAFPRPASEFSNRGEAEQIEPQGGMDLRDYFAAQSLAMLARLYVEDWKENEYLKYARKAYKMAEAMIEARQPDC